MTKKERDALPDSEFGLPKQRKFPIHDKKHLLMAIKMFHHCPIEDRPELARNIARKAKKFNVKIRRNTLVAKYLPKNSPVLTENIFYDVYQRFFENVTNIKNNDNDFDIKVIKNIDVLSDKQINQIVKLENDLAEHDFQFTGIKAPRMTKDFFIKYSKRNDINLILALDEDNVIGYMLILYIKINKKIRADINSFIINEKYRGLGLSSKIFKKAFEVMIKRNCDQSILAVAYGNDHAYDIYSKNGYKPDNIRIDFNKPKIEKNYITKYEDITKKLTDKEFKELFNISDNIFVHQDNYLKDDIHTRVYNFDNLFSIYSKVFYDEKIMVISNISKHKRISNEELLKRIFSTFGDKFNSFNFYFTLKDFKFWNILNGRPIDIKMVKHF